MPAPDPPSHARRLRLLAPLLPLLRNLLLTLAVGVRVDAFAQAPPPAGEDKTAKTRVLELAAKLMQRSSPLGPMDVYRVGIHPAGRPRYTGGG